ncbi:hypothetical protein G6F46_000686 [Rhizopus delemar]|nr:hypothetical protein G6F54_000706 [Rhizopus delemar]KAG1562841.1 hypothetical protein G6F49_000554 [Rhizopus delemar]KAG1575828.1 hypothetical protein G6F50_000749 [Rhizopus delemar]KAG1596274.1 hypothetical protein G6F48_000090 [Rhizopus delemar]KAG1603701.1 hypothetical protein G6F47_001600 [Rhizopus delemar]
MPSFQQDMLDVGEGTNSIMISSLLIGAIVGAIFSGPLADALGRKALMALGTIIFIFGNVLQVGADDLKTMYGGRSITGVSMGMLSMVVPLYQSEIVPKNMRGRLMSIQQFTTTLGIAASYWVDYAFANVDGSMGWRLAIGFQLIPALVCLIGLILFIPESPRYSIDKKHTTEALVTLSKIRGDGTVTHNDVLKEFIEMKQNITFEHKIFKNDKYKRIFFSGPENNRRRLLLGMAVQIFQQLTGVNAILVYAPQIFQAAGLTGRDVTLFANGLSGSINLLATIPAIFFIDKWGRRPTMIIGAILCFICLGIMAVLSGLYGYGYGTYTTASVESTNMISKRSLLMVLFDTNGPTIGFLVVTYSYVAAYACTWGTLGWVYPAELYSQGVRAKALGISTASNWLFTYIVLQLTPIMLERIHWRTYVLFCVMSFIIAIIVHYYFPETSGKSLEEVDLIFSCRFNYYDVNVHHPQTAAEALEQMERVQQRDKNSSEPANSDSSIVLGSTNETESCTEDRLRRALQALVIEQNCQWIDRAIDLNEKLQSEVSFQLETINNKLMDILKRMIYIKDYIQEESSLKPTKLSKKYVKNIQYFDSSELLEINQDEGFESSDESSDEEAGEGELSVDELLARKARVRRWINKEKEQLSEAISSELIRDVAYTCLKRAENGEVDLSSLQKPTVDNIDWRRISKYHLTSRSPAECQIQWREEQDPNVNTGPWTEAETNLLRQLVATHGERGRWDKIVEELGTGRTIQQCFSYYMTAKHSMEFSTGKWEPEEDERLMAAVKAMKHCGWQQIAAAVGDRSGAQCLHRWTRRLDPSINKGKWSVEEDRALKRAVDFYGDNCWFRVQKLVPGRTDVQCRERWNYILVNPNVLKEETVQAPFTEEDKRRIMKLVEEHGKKWSYIASLLGKKSGKDVRSAWVAMEKSRERTERLEQQKKRLHREEEEKMERKRRRREEKEDQMRGREKRRRAREAKRLNPVSRKSGRPKKHPPQ